MEDEDRIARRRAHLHEHLQTLAGLDDPSGVEVISLIHWASNLCDALEARACDESGLSGPRFAVLMRLFAEEAHGHPEGLTPTSLSRFQSVSKNTISALLRGLEEQGLIQRTLDPQDYRVFRIQLTDAGRDLVKATAPQRMRTVNDLASGLTAEERERLIDLLGKLLRSLKAHVGELRGETSG